MTVYDFMLQFDSHKEFRIMQGGRDITEDEPISVAYIGCGYEYRKEVLKALEKQAETYDIENNIIRISEWSD